MSSEWRESKWGDEIVLEYGKGIRGYANAPGPVRVFGTNGPVGWCEEPISDGPGVILGRKGAYRGVHYSPGPFFVIDTGYYVRPLSDLHMRWIYYALIHQRVGEIDDGSPIPSTTRSAVYALPILIPPLPVQRAIAEILGALDDKIDANLQMNETLEGIAQTIFKSWFANFDPVHAKMEQRDTGLAPDLSAEFTDGLNEEGIPNGWQTGNLGDLCTLKRGYDLPTTQREAGQIPIISSSGSSGTHSRAKVEGPGVVTGRYGTIGKVFFVDTDFWPLNTALYVSDFRGNEPRIIYYTLRSIDYSKFTDKAAVPGVNRNDLHKEPVSIAPSKIQRAFVTMLKPIWDRQLLNTEQIETLSVLRALLLPGLMSGKIRVKEAEKFIREAGA